MKRVSLLLITLLLVVLAGPALADEGMWQPHQLSQMADHLKDLGLEIDPEKMADLTAHPMNAVIWLGGCTASFVSPDGLVITNHHCAFGSLQYNSTEETNLMQDGFLAQERSDELFAGPGTRVLVTESFDEVTDKITMATAKLEGRERYKAIEAKQKELVKACEEDEGHRCRVSSFHGGLQYYLFKQLEIRDVRLVHAPAGPVGKFGGDIDNWMWPRHTGDYSFYRAYVDKNGQPADFSEDNVPFRPKHFLKVSDKGLQKDDYVMVTGYPGRTNRYRLANEVESTFGWSYPRRTKIYQEMLNIIETETEGRPDAAIKYARMIAGLNNVMKNNQGMLEGYAKSDIVDRKESAEEMLVQWIASDAERQAQYGTTLDGLTALVEHARSTRERGAYYNGGARGSRLLGTAVTLYRLAREKEKPDAERRRGYQERDLRRRKEGLQRFDRGYDAQVDRALWHRGLENYAPIPADQHVAEFDQWFGIAEDSIDMEKVAKITEKMYAESELDKLDKRLEWFEASRAAFEASEDPFIQLAVQLYDSDTNQREEGEERAGRFNELRPAYMEATIAYRNSLNKPVYPDANSTLRVTFGKIRGYSANDAVRYLPFTTLDGILEKDTGEDPFDSPPKLLKTVQSGRFGRYADPKLGTVPVNFLADLDITGGNSGSPTLNSKGEIVGLVFDGNWESIISDWDFLPKVTRSIHVDMRYILWVMDFVDEADHLLEEMGIAPDDGSILQTPVGP
jgi:hypothetical protein